MYYNTQLLTHYHLAEQMVIRRTSNQRIRTRAHSRKTQHIVSHKPREWTDSLRCSLHVAALYAHHYFTIAGIRALSELQKSKHRFDVLPISLYDHLLIDLIHFQVLLWPAQLTISPCFLGWLQKLSMTPRAPPRASRDNFHSMGIRGLAEFREGHKVTSRNFGASVDAPYMLRLPCV